MAIDFSVITPVNALMLKAPASVPDNEYVMFVPDTSVALAVKIGVVIGVPSTTVTLADEVIVGATSVTATVTACVLLRVPSDAITLIL